MTTISTPPPRHRGSRGPRLRMAVLGGLAGLVLAALGGEQRPARAAERPVVVFAAASLMEAMNHVGASWAAQGHPAPRLSFASSAVLAQQAAQGAPADLFVSADESWMDWLARRAPLQPGTRSDLLGNTLVLVEPRDRMKPATLARGFDLAGRLGPDGRLAVGDPASVPAGIYARAALTGLGLWPSVANRLAPAGNVRAALLLVQRGEAPAGIVYGSDVRAAPSLAVAGTFPADSHPPIRYPVAALTGAPETARFLAFLHGPDAAAAFRAAGFEVLR